MNNAVSKLKEYMQKFRQYETIENLLYWDLSTMTPEKGVESKADAIGYFSTEAFRLSTSDEYGALLKELSTPEQFEQLDDALKVTVQRELRNYERFVRVPEDFYTEYVTCKARSQKAWKLQRRQTITPFTRLIWTKSFL